MSSDASVAQLMAYLPPPEGEDTLTDGQHDFVQEHFGPGCPSREWIDRYHERERARHVTVIDAHAAERKPRRARARVQVARRSRRAPRAAGVRPRGSKRGRSRSTASGSDPGPSGPSDEGPPLRLPNAGGHWIGGAR